VARKVGQIIARGDRTWLIRVYLGRDHETKKRKYHNRTIHGPIRKAQASLTRSLRERDLGRDLEGTKITFNSAASIGPMKYLAHHYVPDDADSLPSKHLIQREPFRKRRGDGQRRRWCRCWWWCC
jgi:hypothetical protein